MNIIDYHDKLDARRELRANQRVPQNWEEWALMGKFKNPEIHPQNWEEWALGKKYGGSRVE